MCGRFSFAVMEEEFLERYGLDSLSFVFQPRYNIAPGQFITTIISVDGQLRAGQLKWGFVPYWAKDTKMAYKMINARAETVHEKPAFRSSFKLKRCIIPANSFFEWKTTNNGKQPMRIMLTNREIFSMAGLYDTWTAHDGTKLHTCTIITTSPNELMASIHDRMPVILRPEDEKIWLDRDKKDTELLLSLLQPYSTEKMTTYPVSTIVNSVKNDTPKCIEKITI